MKFGQQFQAESVPQWAPFNLDYDELKQLIKTNTSKDKGQSIAIPGHTDTALVEFESSFYTELSNQHDRVGLFVKSKSDEIGRRLQYLQTIVLRLLARCTNGSGRMTRKRLNKFSKYDAQIKSCGEDLMLLDRFIDAQRVAFYKLLKKYRKWTGSRVLSERFNAEILGDPKSFTRQDYSSLQSQYNDLITLLRASTPQDSEPTSPRETSRRPSLHHAPAQPQPRISYWNEYDNGSDVGQDEPYTIYVDPDAESTFPGANTVIKVFKRTKAEIEKVKSWFTPPTSPDRESLLGRNNYFGRSPNGTLTDIEDDAYASSSDYPRGYVAHYATFPSVSDQRLSHYQETTYFWLMISSFLCSAVFLAMSGTLLATGRHKLRAEVDLGALTGAILGFFLAVSGLLCMVYRSERLGWIHRGIVVMTFVLLCGLSITLMVVVNGN